MAEIGRISKMTVLREAAPGLYLDGGSLGEILLPGSDLPPGTAIRAGDTLEAFVYLDSEDRLVATLRQPLAQVGEFAALKVAEVHPRLGAFLAWGLPKDLLLPYREQSRPVREGQTVVVFVFCDAKSQRIIASSRLNRHLNPAPAPYPPGAAVRALVATRTPLGYVVIVENEFAGFIYADQLTRPIEPGQRLKLFVRERRPDGKLDLNPAPLGYRKVLDVKPSILAALRRHGGRLPYSDDTPPEVIREQFGCSKKSFKQALGALYKERLIRLTGTGIELLK
jgi:predicted RNA-binding protein (virulence factor B family)